MEKTIIKRLHKNFEDYRQEEDGVEFWRARDLQELLEYTKWDNFKKVISKAKESCENSGQNTMDHFADAGKMVELGSGAVKEIDDMLLTRYACYLIAQNGDPRKEVIAFAQTYFAVQTRKQELLVERLELQERVNARKKLSATETKLSQIVYERGVKDHNGFARIRNKGDEALFGGYDNADMKKKMGITSGPLADRLPTITIKAKDFATELTNFNVEKEDLQGEYKITNEHVKNNTEVRGLLTKRGIKPEELPAEEDTKKIERKLKGEVKSLSKISKLKIGNKK